MSKLRDIYRVLAGDLSTEAITRLIHTNNELRREIRAGQAREKQAYISGRRVGEAVAKGDSKTIAEAAVTALLTTQTPYYCAQCDRATIHYLTGHCLQCGVKCE